MDEQTNKIIQERYNLLPQKIQEFILKEQVVSSIQIIGEKYRLPPDKVTVLENEIIMTLLALEPIAGFDERIMAELLIPGSLATSIERDVKKLIFLEVEQELLVLEKEYAENEKKIAAESPSAPNIPLSPVFKERITGKDTVPEPKPTNTETVPSYSKPMTDIPRYVSSDPYREPKN